MCLYIVDNVSTSRIIYFRYVDTEKRNNLNAIFEYRVGHFGIRDSNFFGQDSNSRVSCPALVCCEGKRLMKEEINTYDKMIFNNFLLLT